jgi:hypothetical protein
MRMASIDSGEPAKDLSETFQDCSFLVGAVFLSALSYLGRLGFYLDDWWDWGLAYQCKERSAICLFLSLSRSVHEGRPVRDAYLAVTFRLFGPHPLLFHLLNTTFLAGAAVLICLCIRELQLPRSVSLTVPLVFALLPQYATDRFWIGVHLADLCLVFGLFGLFLGLRAASARNGWRASFGFGLPSAVSFVISLLSYEVLIGLYPLLFLLIAYRVYKGRRNRGLTHNKAIIYSLGYSIFVVAFLGITLPYKIHNQTRFALSQPHGSLIHVRSLLRHVATQAISFTVVKYGIELPSAAITLYRSSGAGMFPVITGGVLAISVFWYLNRVLGRPNSDRLSAKCALGMIFAGFVVFAFAYIPFFVWFGVDFFSTNLVNRITIGAAIGAALVMAGCVQLLASLFQPARLRLYLFVTLMAVVCALNHICVCSLAEYWARARAQQDEIVSEVRSIVRPPAGTTLLLDGFCPHIGPAVSFVNEGDTSPAFWMALGDSTVNGDIASFGSEVGTDSIVLPPEDPWWPARQYAFGEKLWLYDVGRRTVYRLSDSLEAKRDLRTANACPMVPGDDDDVGPSWSLIPRWSGPHLGDSVSSP